MYEQYVAKERVSLSPTIPSIQQPQHKALKTALHPIINFIWCMFVLMLVVTVYHRAAGETQIALLVVLIVKSLLG